MPAPRPQSGPHSTWRHAASGDPRRSLRLLGIVALVVLTACDVAVLAAQLGEAAGAASTAEPEAQPTDSRLKGVRPAGRADQTIGPPATTGPVDAPPQSLPPAGAAPPKAQTLPDRLQQPAARVGEAAKAPGVDEGQLAAAGIRKLRGKHLTLFTDLPAGPSVDELIDVFDQAYPQWCDYFGVKPPDNAAWHIIGCLIDDKERFKKLGLLPDDLPPFQHAFNRSGWLWVYEQPSEYYRRHLVLHEGTHAFGEYFFGSNGPPWYSEGTAELMATHLWRDGRLTMNFFPLEADDVPGWGRIRLVHDAINDGRAKSLAAVMAFDDRAHIDVEPYGWCWAALTLVEHDPHYRERYAKFVRAAAHYNPGAVNREFRQAFLDTPERLAELWQVFTTDLDCGYDFDRATIDFRAGEPLAIAGESATIAADRGWQSSGIKLAAGKTYRVTAEGRYQVAAKPRPWIAEPDGITIRWWHHFPLGALIGAIHPDDADPAAPSPLLRPTLIGSEAILRPRESGTLYLRVNDSSAELSDNAGKVEVRVVEEKGG